MNPTKTSLFKRLTAACNRALRFGRRNITAAAVTPKVKLPRPKNRLGYGWSTTRFGLNHDGVRREDFMQEFYAQSSAEAKRIAAERRARRAARNLEAASC